MIYLIRHGMTAANERRLYCGSSDLPLSDAGRRALEEKRGQARYPDAQGAKLISSGMRRCDETALLLFGREPDCRVDGLREINFGRFELHSYAELCADADYQAWITDESGCAAPPGGEAANAFEARVAAAIKGVADGAIVVCHGGVIAALMARWFPEEGKHIYAWQPDFGEGYAVSLSENDIYYIKIPFFDDKTKHI